jgi:hypothetical protein
MLISDLPLLFCEYLEYSHQIQSLLLHLHRYPTKQILIVLYLECIHSLIHKPSGNLYLSPLSPLPVQEELDELLVVDAVISGTEALELELQSNECLLVKECGVVVLQDIDEVMYFNPTLVVLVEGFHAVNQLSKRQAVT